MEPHSDACLVGFKLTTGTISITDRRISKFIALIDKFLLSASYVTARKCAIIVGHVMSSVASFG